jgi:hypothetical protein
MDGLKFNKKALLVLIGLDLFMAIGSNIADWPWLMSVNWYLMPFAPICSLYPLTLTIWFSLRYFNKKNPSWFTAFIYMGITTYGVMAYIYYPLYMNWDGIQFRLAGNIVWVTIYALQSFIILSDLKKLPLYQYALIFGYFAFKDFSDRFLGSFIDILRPDFPAYLTNIFTVSIVVLHICSGTSIILLPRFQAKIKAAFSKINTLRGVSANDAVLNNLG